MQESVVTALDDLMGAFLESVSFAPGGRPSYERIHALFIDGGLLIRNVGGASEVTTVAEFIRPREELVRTGRLTEFRETELSSTVTSFGAVAHRTSVYDKEGVQDGERFAARGVILTQFVETRDGWRMSAMTWDDERPGLTLDDLGTG